MARQVVISVLLLAAMARILHAAAIGYPLGTWTLWPVLSYWALATYATVGCFGLGGRLLKLLGSQGYDLSEQFVIGFALGVLGFTMLVVMAGGMGLLTPTFAMAAPLIGMAAYGPRPWLQLVGTLRALVARFHQAPLTWPLLGSVVLGALMLSAVYVPILSLHNIQHDARWYHLPIAAQYAAQGSLAPFAEGWILSAYPHLSSYLYAWALLLPMEVGHRLGVAAHLEFLLFVATVASVPALVRRVSQEGGSTLSWAVFFLFPGYLTYDSNLSLGGDHVAALWAIPLLLVLMQLWQSLCVKDAVLLGALCAAAAGTKYSAACLVVPVAAGVIVVAGKAMWTRWQSGALSSLVHAFGIAATIASVFAIVWSPHWLKNWVSYGDPLYPILNHLLDVYPWNPTTARLFNAFSEHEVTHVPRTLEGAASALVDALSYGLTVSDYGFHKKQPVFGFLFAALLPVLPFLRLGRRLWATTAMAVTGLVVWQLTYARDRYVQALLPWLVVVAAVALRRCWVGRSWMLRGCAGLLVALQVLLSTNVFFLRSHIMADGKHPLLDLMDRVTTSFLEPQRWSNLRGMQREMQSWVAVGKLLPKQAKVLVHRQRLWVGIDAPVVTDESNWQAGIDYDRLGTARALFAKLRRYGVSHVVVGDYPYNLGMCPDTLGGELLLWDLLYASKQIPWKGPWTLWRLPRTLPSKQEPLVAVNNCKSKSLAPGNYRLSALGAVAGKTPVAESPLTKGDPGDTSRPRFAVTAPGCPRPPKIYTRITMHGDLQLWWDKPQAQRSR